MNSTILRRTVLFPTRRAACPGRFLSTTIPGAVRPTIDGLNPKEERILGMLLKANTELKAQGIDPEPSVPDRNALFVKMPGSYRTRLVSPVAPGMSSHLSTPLDEDGLKFGAPNMDLIVKFDNRGDTLVDQAAKLIMRDGKLTVARSNINYVLNHLRKSPPPKYKADFKQLLETPDPSSLPLDPVRYFTLAIDSVAPLLRIKSVKGAGGGGQSLHLPVPVNVRQRRRIAIKWIIASANKRQNRLSGKNTFAHRLGEEIIAIVEGRSAIWDRRNLVHKEAVMNRANMGSMKLKKRGRMMR